MCREGQRKGRGGPRLREKLRWRGRSLSKSAPAAHSPLLFSSSPTPTSAAPLLLPSSCCSHRACPPLSLEQQQRWKPHCLSSPHQCGNHSSRRAEWIRKGARAACPPARITPPTTLGKRACPEPAALVFGPVFEFTLDFSGVPRRDKRRARCVCVCLCASPSLSLSLSLNVCVCVGWIHSPEKTQTHRFFPLASLPSSSSFLFVYLSRCSSKWPHRNFSITPVFYSDVYSSSSRGL